MIEENIDDINKEFLISNNKKTLKIIIDNVDFYFQFHYKKESNNLMVFSNGAIDTNIRKPPVFMRSSWSDDINANCLFIDDRTIHNSDLKIGWGVGTTERHYLNDYNKFVKLIGELFDIKPNQTIYFGSSAGGFMSMAMASDYSGSKAVVNNPQAYVYNYTSGSVKKLFRNIFPKEKDSEIIKNYKDRFSITRIMSKNKNVPEIHYLQNRLCESDMERQFYPFCKMLDKYNVNSESINFVFYNNKKSGHNPMNKDSTIKFLNNVIHQNIDILI